MSAFQVNEACLYDVINLVSKCGSYGEYYKELPDLIKLAKEKPAGLFDKLVKLNRFSLVERYGKNNGLEFKVKFDNQGLIKSVMKSNQYQQLKSLECFLYQSCEGEAEKTDLFKYLESLKNQFMSNIIDKLPEYKQASWG